MDEFTGAQQRVGHLERERTEKFLQDAYAQGRLDEDEFEQRIDLALNARTRVDLNRVVSDLVPVRTPWASHPVYRPTTNNSGADLPGAKATAGFAHLLPFISWIFGPALVYAISPKGSYAKAEAAKSFNWTLVSSILFVLIMVLSTTLGIVPDFVLGLAWIAWVVLTIIGSAQAFSGAHWANPVMRLIRWRPLPEK